MPDPRFCESDRKIADVVDEVSGRLGIAEGSDRRIAYDEYALDRLGSVCLESVDTLVEDGSGHVRAHVLDANGTDSGFLSVSVDPRGLPLVRAWLELPSADDGQRIDTAWSVVEPLIDPRRIESGGIGVFGTWAGLEDEEGSRSFERASLALVPSGPATLLCVRLDEVRCIAIDESVALSRPFVLPGRTETAVVDRYGRGSFRVGIRIDGVSGLFEARFGPDAPPTATLAPLRGGVDATPWNWPLAPKRRFEAARPVSIRAATPEESSAGARVLQAFDEIDLHAFVVDSGLVVLASDASRGVVSGRFFERSGAVARIRRTPGFQGSMRASDAVSLVSDRVPAFVRVQIDLGEPWGSRDRRLDRLLALRRHSDGTYLVVSIPVGSDLRDDGWESEDGRRSEWPWYGHRRDAQVVHDAVIRLGEVDYGDATGTSDRGYVRRRITRASRLRPQADDDEDDEGVSQADARARLRREALAREFDLATVVGRDY